MGIHRHRWALGLILALAAAQTAAAQGTSNDELRREIDALKRKVDALEQEKEKGKPAAGKGEAGKPGAAADEDEELRALRDDADEASKREPGKGGGAGSTGAPQPAPSGTTQGGQSFGGTLSMLNAFNPRMSVFGDFVGRAGLKSDKLPEDDHLFVREVELDTRADVDPYAKAVVILAVEAETPNDYAIDVEEGYVTLETLPLNLRAQIGRWRQRFGQANRTHRHDLMWVDYPVVLRDFLGEEGLIGDGISLLWLAPGFPLELEATVLDGGNPTLFNPDSHRPSYLGRASGFFDLPLRSTLNVGASYLAGYNDTEQRSLTQVVGGDAMLAWKPTVLTSIAAIAEVYHIDREQGPGLRADHAFGWYGALQVQPIQNLYFGARYEESDYGGRIEGNDQWAGSFYVSYYTTEFLRFRAGYEHRERRLTGLGDDGDLDTLLLQVTFVFGSHPVEPFWVNR